LFVSGEDAISSVSNGLSAKRNPEAATQSSSDGADPNSSTCSISDVDNLPIMNAADAAHMLTPNSSVTKLSKHAMDIMQTTPELASNNPLVTDVMRREKGGGATKRPISLDLENLPEGVAASSLFAELASQEPDMIGEMDTGADITAMGKELENVMTENKELVATK
jgi:hypothetical protein